MNTSKALRVTLVTLAFPACAGHGARPVGQPETLVTIENHHPQDVAVYLAQDDFRQRVATLTRMGTHTIDLTRWVQHLSGADVRFEIRPAGQSHGYLLPAIPFERGDWLRMIVRSRPHESTLWKS